MHSRDCNPSQRNRTGTKPAVGDLLPEVRMTVEEYLRLVEAQTGTPQRPRQMPQKVSQPKRKRAGKAAKGMAQAMKEANAKLRKANGELRKGKTQADVARLAHKIRRQKYA